tara:strand:+ start:298 stop:777 length:480 start_codon:yes stop_codon:yes gene_type:complete
MAIVRKINSLEGALRDAIERFGSEKVAVAIGKSKDYVNNLSNPNQKNIGERRIKRISHEDSIILDKFCLANEMAPPMIAVHQMILDDYRSNLDESRSIEQSISNISFRFAEVVNKVETSLDPKSEKGIEFSDNEKKHIHQSIKELEEQLLIFKKLIANT